jgi:hypothetical protein
MASRKTTGMDGVGKQVGADAIIADFFGEGEMIEIPCSRKYSNGEAVYVCTETGLVRAKGVRSSKEIARIWSEEVFGGEFDAQRYTSRIPAVLARQTYVAAFADENIGLRGKEVCDIGAGEGQFHKLLCLLVQYFRQQKLLHRSVEPILPVFLTYTAARRILHQTPPLTKSALSLSSFVLL